MHLETKSPLDAIRVIIMANLHLSMNVTRSSTDSFSEVSFLFFDLYGSAGLSPVSALLNDMLVVEADLKGLDDEVGPIRVLEKTERCLVGWEVSNEQGPKRVDKVG